MMFQFLATTQADQPSVAARRRSSSRHLLHKTTALTISVFAALVAQGTYAQAVEAKSSDRPNIVFIMADDMGYGDVAALNNKSRIPTPHLDRLAAAGMIFTDAHTPSGVCTPTRYGVLTGRYCWRSPLKRGVLNGYGKPLIERERPTVASVLKASGYYTGVIGKWHLGLGFAQSADGKFFDFSQPVSHGPNQLGFDYSYIIPASLDFPPYVYIRDNHLTQQPTIAQKAQRFPAFLRKGERSPDLVMEECLDHLTQRAVEFLRGRAAQQQPFLLYFPLSAPHKPVLPHPRFGDKTELGPYGDFVAQVDWSVGRVLETLDEIKLADETLVIYTSDNGSFMYRSQDAGAEDHVVNESIQAYQPKHHTANYVFRGTKADIWEGGHHVPFLARWPKQIKPGSRCEETICLTDFFATAAEFAQTEVPAGAAPDSFSFAGLLRGGSWSSARAPIIHHSAAGMFAIRDGKWKLVLGNGSGGREKPSGKPFAKPYTLFDLQNDISEKHNLAPDHPEIVARLEDACRKIIDSGGSR